MNKIFLLVVVVFFIAANGFSQEKKYKALCVAFYNLENLYDTVNDPNKNDEEFLPDGGNKWNTEKYNKKLANMSTVISQIGDEIQAKGPVVLGVSEIENIKVLQDLVASPLLAPMNYGIVQIEGPDKRGVDVALLYQKQHFTVTSSRSVTLSIVGKPDFKTRDQLVVSGLLDGEQMHFIVNHWPSRSGGEKKSAPLRNAAADLCKSITDSIMKTDANAKIVIMGDLNDDPSNKSLTEHLKVKGDEKLTQPGDLYNPMYKMHKEGVGSLAYRDNWNIFDQMIVSQPLLLEDKSSLRFLKARVFKKNYMVQKDGAFAGYPFRTFVAGTWQGGYSDHFPVYIVLVKEK
ncbi:MAG: endonuclease/exonuclease/phosphatase family protein [Bacteroidia bacterium]|nr:endonuclease/exonuclease/phosphatase family protein [Bacteroidia bacterium]